MTIITDVIKARKSKRVLLAIITAAVVSVNGELALFDDEMLTKITALAGAIIVGDSLRPTNPAKQAE